MLCVAADRERAVEYSAQPGGLSEALYKSIEDCKVSERDCAVDRVGVRIGKLSCSLQFKVIVGVECDATGLDFCFRLFGFCPDIRSCTTNPRYCSWVPETWSFGRRVCEDHLIP